MTGLQLGRSYKNKATGETCNVKTCAYADESEKEIMVLYKKENRSLYIMELSKFLKEFEII